MKKLTINLLLMFFLSVSITGSGFNTGVEINGYYSDNIFMNSTSIKDFVTNLSADFNLTGKNVNVYLGGDVLLFSDNSEFNSFRVRPGIEFLRYLKGRNYIYLDLSYSFLEYRDFYTDFNYSGPSAELGLKFYLAPTVLFKSGYSFELRDYPNFSSFDFINHTVFLELNKFFRSQTTLRFQTGFNYRYYGHIARIIPENDWEIDPDTDSISTIAVPNLSGTLRISQGIGTKAGIFGEAEMRKNFRGLEDAETLINNSYVIYPYNDNYLWDGSRLTLGFKFILFSEVSAGGSLSLMKKNYPGIYVMNEEGIVPDDQVEREDTLTQLDLSVSKKFRGADIFINFSLRNNVSNDLFFDYGMLTLSVGIRYYF